jgi:plastocyanin
MINMEAKHWFGLVGGGIALLGASFFLNSPKYAWEVAGARKPDAALSEATAELEEPSSTSVIPSAPVIRTPEVSTTRAPKPQSTSTASKPKPSGSTEGPPVEVTPTGELSRDWKGAMIAGTVKWDDKPQRDRVQDISSDPVCVNLNPEPLLSEQYVIDDNNNLANVIVYVDKVPQGDYPKRTGDVLIDQVNCRYVPHVLGIQIGQIVIIRNSDPTGHNVHWKSKLNSDWNISQSAKGDISPKQEFVRAEVGTSLFKCDVHPWMEARVGLFDHPFFAVSKADGTFEIPQGLPDGKYTVNAWHEKAKTATATLTVVKGKTSEVTFIFTRKDNSAKVIAEGK